MRQRVIGIVVWCLVSATVMVTHAAGDDVTKAKSDVLAPSHQVIAAYFHRTERCPTCKRIGALASETMTKGFVSEMESKAVQIRLVDFQDPKYSQLAAYYKIKGPTLILMDVNDGKVTRWMPMPKVWQFVGQPEKFHAYVGDAVKGYLNGTLVEPEVNQ